MNTGPAIIAVKSVVVGLTAIICSFATICAHMDTKSVWWGDWTILFAIVNHFYPMQCNNRVYSIVR